MLGDASPAVDCVQQRGHHGLAHETLPAEAAGPDGLGDPEGAGVAAAGAVFTDAAVLDDEFVLDARDGGRDVVAAGRDVVAGVRDDAEAERDVVARGQPPAAVEVVGAGSLHGGQRCRRTWWAAFGRVTRTGGMLPGDGRAAS